MQDCYKSILESFIHAGSNETKVNIISIHSEYIDAQILKIKDLDGILSGARFWRKRN
jgi:CTP synthase